MTRSRPKIFLTGAALTLLTALSVSACGSNNTPTATSHAANPAPKPAAHQVTTVRVASTGLGKVLVDGQGRTLYLFSKDSATSSACSGACAMAWPPLSATGNAEAGAGAKASLIGKITRSDGTSQVTYGGHPLYGFVKDMKAGDTNGEGVTAFGGNWFAVSPAGKRISSPKQGSGSSSSQAPPPAATPTPTPTPAATPAPKPSATPTPSSGIPQNNGGDADSDNNGGPSDGDGNI